MTIIDLHSFIKEQVSKEFNISSSEINDVRILYTFDFPKHNGRALGFPLIDKDIQLIESEVYINGIGHKRIYAYEIETKRIMDINQDTLELITKTNRMLNEIRDDIRHLDFFKSDNKNISCQKVSIKHDSEPYKETAKIIGNPKQCDYTLPSIRKYKESIEKTKSNEE